MRQPGKNGQEGNRRQWVDPRSEPTPPAVGLPDRVTDEPDDIAALVEHCKKGRLYAVERWIQAGKPIQARYGHGDYRRRGKSPLAWAVETGQHDLALLLLCNGYRLELEPRSLLDLVLQRRSADLLELLLAWGADPKRADPNVVLDTYQIELMERFWELGVDYTRNSCLASYLASSTRNRPAYGWAKRHNGDPKIAYALAQALGDALQEENDKAVNLLRWAGADPHRPVSSLRWGSGVEDDPDDFRESAIEAAVHMGRGTLLPKLRPDPALDEFEELYAWVSDPDVIDYLTALRPPADWSKAIAHNISRMGWSWSDSGSWQNRRCLEHIFEGYGGRLSGLGARECQDLRRDLLKCSRDSDLKWLLRTLAKPERCAPAIYAELTRTPTIRERMARLGLLRAATGRGVKRLVSRQRF